jgi:hypothetical protein
MGGEDNNSKMREKEERRERREKEGREGRSEGGSKRREGGKKEGRKKGRKASRHPTSLKFISDPLCSSFLSLPFHYPQFTVGEIRT